MSSKWQLFFTVLLKQPQCLHSHFQTSCLIVLMYSTGSYLKLSPVIDSQISPLLAFAGTLLKQLPPFWLTLPVALSSTQAQGQPGLLTEKPPSPPPRPCQSLSHFFFFIHLFICSPLKDNSLKELSHSQFLITLLCSLKPTPDSLFPITTSAKMFLLLSPVSCLLPNLGVSSPFSSYLTYYEYLTLLDLLPQVIFLFLNLDSSYSFGFSLKLASSFVSSKSSARPLPVRAPQDSILCSLFCWSSLPGVRLILGSSTLLNDE